jgi:hypothetical protein
MVSHRAAPLDGEQNRRRKGIVFEHKDMCRLAGRQSPGLQIPFSPGVLPVYFVP